MSEYNYTLFSISRVIDTIATNWASRNQLGPGPRDPGNYPFGHQPYKFVDPPPIGHLARVGLIGDEIVRMFLQFPGVLPNVPTSLVLNLASGFAYNGNDGSIDVGEIVVVSANHVTVDLDGLNALPLGSQTNDLDALWTQLTSQPFELASDDTRLPGPFGSPLGGDPWVVTLNAAGLASAQAATLAGQPIKLALILRKDFDAGSTIINAAPPTGDFGALPEFLPAAVGTASFSACLGPPARIPLEFRPAIGVSSNPDTFDGTAILNLCVDPYVSEGRCGNMVYCRVRDDIDTMFTPRGEVASKKTNRQVFRTGYGVRPAWELEIQVATSRLGFLPPNALSKPEVNDGSLWHLASILGLATTGAEFGPLFPFAPYLFFCPNYQHNLEQWFPVEPDPNSSSSGGSGIAPLTFTPVGTTQARTLSIRLVAREAYKKVLPAYFPSFYVDEIPGITITSLPPFVASLGGFTSSPVVLSAPLPTKTPSGNELGELDALLLNLNNTRYGWKRVTILSMVSDRTALLVESPTDLSGAFLVPPSAPIGLRSVTRSDEWPYLVTYVVTPFAGQTAPARGPQLPIPDAFLLGDPYDL